MHHMHIHLNCIWVKVNDCSLRPLYNQLAGLLLFFTSRNCQDRMRAGRSLPLPLMQIVHILAQIILYTQKVLKSNNGQLANNGENVGTQQNNDQKAQDQQIAGDPIMISLHDQVMALMSVIVDLQCINIYFLCTCKHSFSDITLIKRFDNQTTVAIQFSFE